MPKISVIIPVYNTEKYLKECIESVINQTLKDIEIICVDDGSIDNSFEILKEYAKRDERIIVITQKNQGQGAARNKGIEIAKSEFITFLDADDYLHSNFCETLYKCIKESNADTVLSYIKNFVDKNEQDKENLYYLKSHFDNMLSNASIPTGKYEYNFCTFQKIRTGAAAKLYKKEILDKYEIKFPEGYQQEDEAFHWFYMTRVNVLYCLNEKLYLRRLHTNSVMYNTLVNYKKITDTLYILEIVYDFLKKNNLYKKYKSKYKIWASSAINTIKLSGKKLKKSGDKDIMQQARKQIKALKQKIGILPYAPFEEVREKTGRMYKIYHFFGIKIKCRLKKKEHDYLVNENIKLIARIGELENKIEMLEKNVRHSLNAGDYIKK